MDKIYRYEIPTLLNGIKGKVLIDQIRTVNESRLLEKKGELTTKEMKK